MRLYAGGRHLILAAWVALVLGACATTDSDLVTYTDDDRLSRFDLPTDWNVYEFSEISTLDDLPFDEAVQGLTFPALTSVGFDAGPVRDVNSLAFSLAEANYPIGAAHVRSVGDRERDYLSRAVLTQSVVPYYTLANPQELQKEDFTFGDGFDGVRVLFAFEAESGTDQGVAYMVSVSDPADNRIYSIVAGCRRECFIENQDLITKVVDSWLVNKKA
ncbi:MAG: hypothetical protein L0Z49_04870 [Actinobacteria bacterium]|nr:hypothetical protein [Actinomycetota bacterium]